jgi:hypothetical protein
MSKYCEHEYIKLCERCGLAWCLDCHKDFSIPKGVDGTPLHAGCLCDTIYYRRIRPNPPPYAQEKELEIDIEHEIRLLRRDVDELTGNCRLSASLILETMATIRQLLEIITRSHVSVEKMEERNANRTAHE